MFATEVGSSHGRTWLEIQAPDGRLVRLLTHPTKAEPHRQDRLLAGTTDGSRIAFSRTGSAANGIYVVAVAGGPAVRVGSAVPSDSPVSLSPDGHGVAFDPDAARECDENHPGRFFELRLRIAGTNGTHDLLNLDADANPRDSFDRLAVVEWSPDGRKLLYVVSAWPRTECRFPAEGSLYMINADGFGKRLLLRSDDEITTAHWSPDGRSIAVGYLAGGIGVVDVAGGKTSTIYSGDYSWSAGLVWSSGSARLLFLVAPGGEDTGPAVEQLQSVDPVSKRVRTVIHFGVPFTDCCVLRPSLSGRTAGIVGVGEHISVVTLADGHVIKLAEPRALDWELYLR